MTIGKMTALGLALVGTFALGVWTGPHIVQRSENVAAADDASVVWGSGVPDEPAPAVDNSAAADFKWRARTALTQHGPGADIGVILNVHIAVALHARRKSHEITQHAVVLDDAADVRVKIPSDADVRCDRDEGTEERTLSDHDLVHDDDIPGLDGPVSNAVAAAA